MGNYKGINVPDELMGIIDYMSKLEEDREELSVLSQQWDLLTILGQMNGSGTDMTKTREDFKNLTSSLLSTLGVETLKKTVQSITAKAQVTVDIVIRNLFERTADIGFLATDEDIRKYVQLTKGTGPNFQESADALQNGCEALKARFAEYVAKYSVYEDIILMDCDGRVLCQYNDANPVSHSRDLIVKESLETGKEYVEAFRKSDLCPQKENALLYGFRVRESNDPGSTPIGVLVLVFRFENEMDSVFKNLITQDDWTVLTLLDRDGRVIATSDQCQIPNYSTVPIVVDHDFKITKFGGRLYLSKTCPTKGYQGFMGLGWFGHAMIPLEYAFNHIENEGVGKIDSHVLESVMDEPRLFSAELRSIPKNAESIQSELDRTVWNGNLGKDAGTNPSNSSANKVLLWEISKTGNKTKSVFEKSISDLHQTVVNSILSDVIFVSSLAIDIMDRNLYERANDCRWWAITTDFRQILSRADHSAEDISKMSKILTYINGLYTVYTNIFIFDNHGKVLAVSNPGEAHLVGKALTNEFVRGTLALRGSQKYSVSAFDKSEFYQNRHTYVYGASIQDPENGSDVIGGIGIVFDGEPQFQKMLEDSLPRNVKGQVPEGCFSVFVDRHGKIIATTRKQFSVGEKLQVNEEIFGLNNGSELSKIIKFEGQYYAVGARCSKGYREYKNEKGGYTNDIIALTFFALGAVKEIAHPKEKGDSADYRLHRAARIANQEYVEIATFFIGSDWLGVKTSEVMGAMIVRKVTRMPVQNPAVEGTAMFGDKPIYIINSRKASTSGDAQKELQVVVFATENGPIGLIVDRLGEIPEIPTTQMVKNESLLDGKVKYIEGIVKPDASNPESTILIVVNPSEYMKTLLGGEAEQLSAFDQIKGVNADSKDAA